MHRFINSRHLEYSPATSSVVPSQDDGCVGVGVVGALTYALKLGDRMYVRMLISEEVRANGCR